MIADTGTKVKIWGAALGIVMVLGGVMGSGFKLAMRATKVEEGHSDHEVRVTTIEAAVLQIQMKGHKDHEDRIDKVEVIVRNLQLDERDYKKDIEQIHKDITRFSEDLKAQGADIKAQSEKSDEMLRILLGR